MSNQTAIPVNLDGQSQSDQEIEIDGGSFVDATLTRCTLSYRGGSFPNFSGVRIIDCAWAFRDAASQTLGMLALIRLDWPDQSEELLAAARRLITMRTSN